MKLFSEFQFIYGILTIMIKTKVKQTLLFYNSLIIFWIRVICYLSTIATILARYLVKRSAYICGSLCSDRKGNSHAVTKAKLRKIAFVCFQSGNAVACKWKYKRDVITITSKNTEPEMVPVSNRHGDQKQKPSIFCDSNEEMSGIDRIDLMLLYDSALHKTLRWFKRLPFIFSRWRCF